MSLSITTDLRDQLGPVRDQKTRPTCLAFAASDAHQHAQNHEEEFSAEWIYYHAVLLAGGMHDEGSTIPNTRAIVSTPGQPVESAWPYLNEITDVASWKPPVTTDLFQSSTIEASVSDFDSTLDAETPIVTALYISDAFYFYDQWTLSDGEVILPDDGSPVDTQRGHAVVVAGSANLHGSQHFLLRNSWGSSWANEGHAWIGSVELERRLIGAFTVSIGANYV